jgi:phosphohistidine phosphatase SixA
MKKDRVDLQHRPFLTPIWLVGAAAFLALSFAIFVVWEWASADSTTIVVIRHAEKESGNLSDPPLSDSGKARAARLAMLFGDAKGPGRVDAIYISAALRNRSTAAPLAARLGLAPIVDPSDDPKALAKRVLREHRGGRAMIIGHLNTVPEIVSLLSDRHDIPSIDEQDYGVMYIVTVPRIGHANLLRMTY